MCTILYNYTHARNSIHGSYMYCLPLRIIIGTVFTELNYARHIYYTYFGF